MTRSLYHVSLAADSTHRFMHTLHPAIVVLALCGGLLEWRRALLSPTADLSLQPRPIIAALAYFTMLYTIFAPWPRYSVSLRPELYLLAVWGLERVVASAKKYRADRARLRRLAQASCPGDVFKPM